MKIPSKIPGKLGLRGGSTSIFISGPAAFDYAFNGLPFLSCASEIDNGRRRIRRSTAPFRKDQVDQQVNPGEQSLAGYWLRSQLSFHAGAGLVYSDTGGDNPLSDLRFSRSKNVDPWDRGKLTLLSKAVALSPAKAGTIRLVSFTFGNGTGAVAGIQANAFYWVDQNGSTASAAFVPTCHSITSSGSNLFISTSDGLYRADILTSSVSAWTKIYTYGVSGANASSVVEFVKERLILSTDNVGIPPNSFLYEVSTAPASIPDSLPSPIYTSAVQGWKWVSISETTSAIYAVGQSGSQSNILKFTLETVAGVPTLSSATIACTLPGGEVAQAVFGYLGDRLAIGTSRGARVALAASDGSLTYGPLIFETSRPVKAFAGFDRFIWATYSEATEADIRVARIDLSLEIESLRFAWATDLVGASDVNGTDALAFCGGTNVLAFATSANLWLEHKELKPVEGYLDTARIRLSTIEPKVFRSVRVRGPVLAGPLGISVINEDTSVTPIYTYQPPDTPGFEDITLLPPNRRNYLALRFTLEANGGGTAGAELDGWQVKALPGSPRQRMVTLPIWCFDFEKDRHGQRVGGHGGALVRLRALETMDEGGDVIVFQDLDTNTSRDIFIEELRFEQSLPPPYFEGWGGIIWITYRTV